MVLSSVRAAGDSPLVASNPNKPINKEMRLHVFDHITGTKFLVDSGSVVSLVPRSAVKANCTRKNQTLVSANGTPIPVYGTKLVAINLGLRRDLKWPFTIADVRTPILGADFLAHFGLIIDLKRKRLYYSITSQVTQGTVHAAEVFGVSNPSARTGDYRRLNAQTVPDRYPIPRIEDLLHRVHTYNVFSTIDLERAYHQIQVAPKDVPKTVITTQFGLFEFVGMPPGLRNATQTFQRFIDTLYRGIDFVACYVDDVLVMSHSHEEHAQYLKKVLDILEQNNLTINIKKCQIGKEELPYLSYSISANGFQPPEHCRLSEADNYNGTTAIHRHH